MPQPPAYTIATDFSADESNAVAGRSTVRTTNLDTELTNIKAFIDQMRTNIGLVQADDGTIKDDAVDLPTLADDVINYITTNGNGWYGADTGAVNAMVVTLAPAPTSLTNGMFVVADIKLTNTATAVTLNVNGLGAKAVVTNGAGSLPSVGMLTIGTFYGFQYDSSADKFQIVFSGDSVAQANAASNSATAAANSATASANSAAAAATSYDNFDDRYLGQKSADVSVDNDGASLLTGALYFNTSNNVMMVYSGSAWQRTTPTSSDQTKINTVSGIASDVTALAGVSTQVGLLGTADAIADMNTLGTADVVADLNTLGTADVVADLNTLGTADVVSDMNTLATADIVADMNTLATSANVTAMGHLGTSANVTAMGLLGTSAVVTDMGILGTADVVADMNTLGTADVVADMNTLGTADVVNDMNTLATGANVTAMGLLGTSANVTAMGLLGNSATITDLSILGTADVVTDLNTLGTADVVSDLNTLGTADVVSDMNTLGTSANVTNMASCAANLASINSYGETYTVAASAPGSPNEGDLWFDSTNNVLKVYNSTTWVAVTSATAGIMNVADDGTPQLGGDLDVNGNSIVSVSNANISITPNGSGSVVVDGLSHPQTDGSAGQFLKTNGSGQLSFATVTTDLVGDLSPQLGSSLDVNGQSIVSVSNGNISITPNGTGNVILDGLNYPQADGSTGQFLKTNGSGQLSFATVTTDVVADTTPQLGGALDCQSENITNCGTVSGANLQMDFGGLS